MASDLPNHQGWIVTWNATFQTEPDRFAGRSPLVATPYALVMTQACRRREGVVYCTLSRLAWRRRFTTGGTAKGYERRETFGLAFVRLQE